MAQRRASTNSMPPAADLGTPYQIFHEVVSTGKNVSGSKTKVKWQFGFSNSGVEHTVELKVSFLTGVKRIISDGVEIFCGGSLLETEFEYSWPERGHLFRVDCSLGLTADHVFHLIVDSVKYQDLVLKSGLPSDSLAFKAGPTSSVGASKGFGSSSSGSHHRRSSSGSSGSVNANTPPRADSADPFASKPSAASSTTPSSDPFSSDPFGASASSDPFGSSSDPFGSSSDPFGAPAAANNSTFDSFGSSSATEGNTDPFSAQKPNVSDGFDNTTSASAAAAFDAFGGSATHSAAAPKASNDSLMDLFNSPAQAVAASTPATPSVSTDPFAPTPPSNVQTASVTTDFSNLSFTPPAAPVVPAADASAPSATVAPEKKDSLYSGLVNLDLGSSGGSNNKTNSGVPSRRASLADPSHPSLSSMMGANNTGASGGRPMSMAIPSGSNPYAAGIAGQSNNPFAQGMAPGGAPAQQSGRPQSMAIPGNTAASLYAQPPQQVAQRRSSLDSLNWKG